MDDDSLSVFNYTVSFRQDAIYRVKSTLMSPEGPPKAPNVLPPAICPKLVPKLHIGLVFPVKLDWGFAFDCSTLSYMIPLQWFCIAEKGGVQWGETKGTSTQ